MAKISTRNITAENVDDIMGTAAYGGITYWATDPPEAALEALPEGHHLIQEDEDGTRYHLTPAMIRRAIVEVAEGKHTNPTIAGYVRSAFEGWTAEDGIDCGEIDADAADAIVQVACFGEVIYG